MLISFVRVTTCEEQQLKSAGFVTLAMLFCVLFKNKLECLTTK